MLLVSVLNGVLDGMIFFEWQFRKCIKSFEMLLLPSNSTFRILCIKCAKYLTEIISVNIVSIGRNLVNQNIHQK